MDEVKQVGFNVREIKELEFFVDDNKVPGAQVDLLQNAEIKMDIPSDKIQLTIITICHLLGTQETYIRSRVATVFGVKDLRNFGRKRNDGSDAVDLPDPVWVTLYSIAYTHARAILYRNCSRTKLNEFILPIINPDEEFRKLFKAELERSNEELGKMKTQENAPT